MSENRSLRVELSVNASAYITGMNRAAESTKGLAREALGVRTNLATITPEANKLDASLRRLSVPSAFIRDIRSLSGPNSGLTTAATDIRRLATAVGTINSSSATGLRDVGTALHGIGSLGTGLTTVAGDIRRVSSALGSITPASAAGMRDIGTALHGIGRLSMGGAAAEITAMSTGVRRLVRDANSVPALRALASALRDLGAAGGGLGNLGNVGNSLRGMQSQIDQLRRSIAGLRGAAGGGSGGSGSSGGIFGQIFGGAALGGLASNLAYSALSKVTSGIKDTIKATSDYETEIQTFGAVTKASNAQMQQASALAIKLGGDVTIAGASASDAAGVLTELAKGGLSISESFAAAKGSLQLASAASVDMGTAAGIQTAAINSFALDASSAGKVADILANTAAAASGEITDFAEGMKQSGAVAHNFGLSLLDNQTILAQFAQAGIKGSMGGNILKSALLSVEKAAGPSGRALAEMGVEVKKSNGTYISAAELEEQLAAAKKRMGTTAYNTAAAIAFGTRGVIFANVAANAGAKGFNELNSKISAGAGAAAFSQAKMSGLGGAFKNLQNQVETAQVVVGEKFSGALQTMLGGISKAVPKITAFLTGGALGGGLSSIGSWFKPLTDGAAELATKALPYVKDFLSSVGTGFGSIVTFIHPVVTAIGDFWKKAADNGSVAKVGGVLAEVGTAFKGVLAFVAPVGAAIGGAIKWIGGLGEFGTVVGTVVTAMLGFRLVKPLLTGLFGVVPGFAAAGAAVRSFGATYRALGSTGMGSVSAALGAAAQGAANLGKGLLAAFGGPVGLAIMGITTVIALWPTIMDKLKGSETSAATATKNHTDAVKNLSDALETSNGKIDSTIRKTALDQLQAAKWGKSSQDVTAYADRLANLGVTYSSLIDGMLNVPGAAVKINNAYDTQVKSLQSVITAGTTYVNSRGGQITSYSAEAKAAQGNLDILRQLHDGYAGMAGSLTESTKKYQANAAAIKGTTTAAGGLGAAATRGSGGMKLMGTDTGDMTLALEAARISLGKTGHVVGELAAAAKVAAIDTGAFYKIVGQTDKDPGHAVTAMSQAFDLYNTKVSEADTTTQLFVFTMDKLAGRNVSVEDAMAANASAARALGKSYRDTAASAQAYADAQAKLADDKSHLNDGTDKATTAAQVAADERAVVDAYDATKESINGVNSAATAYQKTAALRVQQVFKDVDSTKGFGAAVRASGAELQKQRDAFIAQQPAADIASGAAGRLADSYRLIPKNIMTILTADPKLAMEAFADARKTLKGYSGDVDRLPKDVKTIFNAEVAVAEKNGQRLYRVYDSTSKTWTATFETPSAATAQIAAKKTVQQYDRAKGTWSATFATPNQAAAKGIAIGVVTEYNKARGSWTANLIATDKATSVISGVQKAIDGLTGKPIDVNVIMKGSTYIQPSTGLTVVGGGGKYATGGQIHGPGTGTSDDIPIMASNGEYVVNAKATARHLPLLHAINSENKFAQGGVVGSIPSSVVSMNVAGGTEMVKSIYGLAQGALGTANKAVAAAQAAAQAAAMASSQSASGLFGSQDPSSFGWGVGKNIVPFSFQGMPFPSGVAAGTSSIWTSFLSQLVPTIPGGLRPGENFGFEDRANVNSPGRKSFHAYGLALDLNAPENGNGTNPGTGLGQVPSSAGALARRYNMLWGGEFSGTKDPMHFELHARPGGAAANSPASALGGGLAAGAGSAGSGVERWRSLAMKVAAAHHENAASVQVMLNQMSRESSGNPAAQNNTDINAQRGTPSKGLLQFIDGTFRANADPGYGSNIWDPESQMRAWYNYINKQYGGYMSFGDRGYGAYADGGLVRGAGSGRSDSNLARVSNGEYIVNAASTSRHLPLLHSINGYASGGLVGSQTALSGRTTASLGPELSNVVSALADIAQAVRDARDAVAPKRDLEAQAWSARNAAKQLQWDNRVAAQNRLQAAKAKQGTENGKTSATERLIDRQKVTAAGRALAATVAADNAAVAKATREWAMARRTATSYANAAAAAERFQSAQQRAYRAQQTYAAQVDKLNGWLTDRSAKLGQLRSERANMMGGISSTVAGFDGGILGHPDTRNTFATILKGQQYDAAQAQKFNVNITKLRKLGLSNSSLNSIASAGVDGGGVTAAALAKATPAQIKQLNAVGNQMHRIGDNVGNVVGGAFYDAGIQSATGFVKGLQSQIGAIQKAMNGYAGAAVGALTRKLQIHSPSRVMHQIGQHTVDGYNNGLLSGYGAVASTMAGMVQVPQPYIPQQSFGRSSGGSQSIDVQVFLDGKRIDERVDVKINGFAVDLGHSFEKASMQR